MATHSSTPNSENIDLSALHSSCSSRSPSLPNNLEARLQKLKSLPGKDPSRPIREPDPFSLSHMDSFGLTRRSRSRSPPQRPVCCFGCFTRKAPSKKGKSKGLSSSEFDGRMWETSQGILTDVGTLSFKEQNRKLKKVLKEEHKASKDAAKLVEWVKQASARMDVSVIDGRLADDEQLK